MSELRRIAIITVAFLALGSGQVITKELPPSEPQLIGVRDNTDSRIVDAALSNEQEPEPAQAEPLVGDGPIREGYVASFGAFSLSKCGKRAMFLAQTNLPRGYFFEDGELKFLRNRWLPCFGWGAIYEIDMEDTTADHVSRRYIFFGHRDACCSWGITQRYLIVWDENWCRINCVLANYGRSICRCDHKGLPCIYQGAQKSPTPIERLSDKATQR